MFVKKMVCRGGGTHLLCNFTDKIRKMIFERFLDFAPEKYISLWLSLWPCTFCDRWPFACFSTFLQNILSRAAFLLVNKQPPFIERQEKNWSKVTECVCYQARASARPEGSTKFVYENCCNSGTESRKIDPKVGNERSFRGLQRGCWPKLGSYGKNQIFRPKPEILGPEKPFTS